MQSMHVRRCEIYEQIESLLYGPPGPCGTSQLTKLQRLIRSAGIGEIDMEKKLVAIKLHFGEPGT